AVRRAQALHAARHDRDVAGSDRASDEPVVRCQPPGPVFWGCHFLSSGYRYLRPPKAGARTSRDALGRTGAHAVVPGAAGAWKDRRRAALCVVVDSLRKDARRCTGVRTLAVASSEDGGLRGA